VSKDLPELRVEVFQGGYHLVLGEEKIASYTERAAAEQVIENWLARRANGETDDQIKAAGGERPTRPVFGLGIAAIGGLPASAGAVLALRAEVAALKALKHPREYGSEGGKEHQQQRREDARLRHAQAVKLIKATIKANSGFSRGEIVDRVLDPKKSDWEGLTAYQSSTIYTIIGKLVNSGEIGPPPGSRK
jgi:hypothetical protein